MHRTSWSPVTQKWHNTFTSHSVSELHIQVLLGTLYTSYWNLVLAIFRAFLKRHMASAGFRKKPSPEAKLGLRQASPSLCQGSFRILLFEKIPTSSHEVNEHAWECILKHDFLLLQSKVEHLTSQTLPPHAAQCVEIGTKPSFMKYHLLPALYTHHNHRAQLAEDLRHLSTSVSFWSREFFPALFTPHVPLLKEKIWRLFCMENKLVKTLVWPMTACLCKPLCVISEDEKAVYK